MAHRDRTIRHVVSPHPHGLPVHSVVDIVLCYIFHDPRFLGGHDPRFLGGHHPRFWGHPLPGGIRPDRLSDVPSAETCQV
jgi:hypothetical protein